MDEQKIGYFPAFYFITINGSIFDIKKKWSKFNQSSLTCSMQRRNNFCGSEKDMEFNFNGSHQIQCANTSEKMMKLSWLVLQMFLAIIFREELKQLAAWVEGKEKASWTDVDNRKLILNKTQYMHFFT